MKGVVIKKIELEEKGRILYVLTENGIVKISARGAKKPTSKNNPAAEMFSYAEFSVSEGKDRLYLDSSKPLKIFWNIRTDIKKLALAAYFAEVLFYCGISDKGEEKSARFAGDCKDELKTFLLALDCLDKDNRTEAFIKAVFEMRTACAIGFLPDLIGCAECYRYSGGMNFDIANGQLFCKEHNKNGTAISESLLDTLRFVCLSPVEKIMSFKIGEKTQKEFSRLAENYLIYHLEKKFKTLGYYRSLR
ncbi:MAG: DNA repair protein RecO [Ruminococcus sp.]|jgi:DNA repair protein RecO (recombination protein O)|nr:DNA repair protein RecO [Ruminococcus sp.]